MKLVFSCILTFRHLKNKQKNRWEETFVEKPNKYVINQQTLVSLISLSEVVEYTENRWRSVYNIGLNHDSLI